MRFLNTLDGLLEHIKSVENETIDLTREGQLRIVRFLEKHKLVLDDDTMEAMQVSRYYCSAALSNHRGD
jgi:hypothetical protein